MISEGQLKELAEKLAAMKFDKEHGLDCPEVANEPTVPYPGKRPPQTKEEKIIADLETEIEDLRAENANLRYELVRIGAMLREDCEKHGIEPQEIVI